jgi:hypothetical protein
MRIPIPPIFVYEMADGQWELVDGLQRLSTILEFTGNLRHPDTKDIIPAISLAGTTYLPSLSGAYWSPEFVPEDTPQAFAFDGALQRAVRRAKLGVQILEKKSDQKSKYDLFQRLNSGGAIANAQELRNCTIIMYNEAFFNNIKSLSEINSFKELTQFSENELKLSRDMEFVCRFISFLYETYTPGVDIEIYVDRAIINISDQARHDSYSKINADFSSTFDLILKSVGKDGLKRFTDGEFKGRIGRTALEIICIGIAKNIDSISALKNKEDFISSQIKTLWSEPDINRFTSAGVSGTDRVRRTIPFGMHWFDPAK